MASRIVDAIVTFLQRGAGDATEPPCAVTRPRTYQPTDMVCLTNVFYVDLEG